MMMGKTTWMKNQPQYVKNKPKRKRKRRVGKASLALKKVNRLQRLYKPETKYHTFSINNPTVDYDGDIYTLNLIAQGDTDQNRNGDAIKMVGMHLAYYMTSGNTVNFNGAAESTNPRLCRVIVFYDKQVRITLVNSYLQSIGTIRAPLSSKAHDNRFQTKLIYDKIHEIDAWSNPRKFARKYIKLPGLLTQYSAGSTTQQTGALRLIVITDSAPVGDIEVQARVKIHFYDP